DKLVTGVQTCALPISETLILVVDDNATNRRILNEMLTNWGMRPVLASNAHEGLRMLRDAHSRREPFRLILSDVNMPDVNGFTFEIGRASCRERVLVLG